MVDRTGCLVLFCALIAASAAILISDAEGKQFTFNWGQLKLTVDQEATSDEDKLNLDKLTMRASFGYNEGADIASREATLREDLVRCKDLLKETPEMESLLACKKLEEHLAEEGLNRVSSRDQSVGYIKRLSISINRNQESTFLSEYYLEQHFYPFEAEHTRLMIDSLLAKQNLTRSELAFNSMSIESGFFVKSKLSAGFIRFECTANLFVMVNQTELEQPSEPLDDGLGKSVPKFARLFGRFKENGGLISVQDSICEPSIPVGHLNSDFTFIYRKQFPFISLKYQMKTMPFEALFDVHGWINQVRNQSSPEAYNTSVYLQSTSKLFSGMNFLIHQDFTNHDFVSGSETMFLYHPMQSLFLNGTWNASSVFQVLEVYDPDTIASVLRGTAKELAKSFMIFLYDDSPDRSKVTLTLAIERDILYDIFKKLGFIAEDKTIKHKQYVISADSLSPELRKSLAELIEQVSRDEL